MSLIDFSKIKMFQKKPKTLGERIAALPVVLRLVVVLLVLSIIGTSILSALNLRTGAQTQNEVFTKLVTYNVNAQTWNTLFSDVGDPIRGMATSTNNVLLYITNQKIWRTSGVVVPTNGNITRTDITTVFTSNTGTSPSELVDITGAFQYNLLLNKDGRIYVTGDAGNTWATYPKPAFINNDAYAIGSNGVSGHPVLYGNGSLAVNTGNANWTNYGQINIAGSCGKPNAVELDTVYAISTEGGCLFYSTNGTTWSEYNYRAPGGYIAPDIYSSGGHIYLSAAMSADRTSMGFFDLDWPGGFPGPVRAGLWATIPGCQVGKAASYIVGGTLGYFAAIGHDCSPNDPPVTPPVVAPGGDTVISNTTNNYNFDTKGVSVHTKVAGPDGTATVRKGENATFTLTVNNPDTVAKTTNVRFLVPQGFTFAGIVPPTPAVSRQDTVGGLLQLTWENYTAQPGSANFLVINTTAPQ